MPAPVIPSKKILVVDDEPFVCDAVKMMLAFDGHDVQTANSGREALDLFDKGKFDLVITDFSMPSMKGDELATAIKTRSPKQPVEMIIAYGKIFQSWGPPLSGVDFMISNPFLFDILLSAIARFFPGKAA